LPGQIRGVIKAIVIWWIGAVMWKFGQELWAN
jgi:hypothetical protein